MWSAASDVSVPCHLGVTVSPTDVDSGITVIFV